MALITMEERKAFWRYEATLKWYRKNLGEHWISIVLDYFEQLDIKEGTTHQRKDIGAYILRMHQINQLMIMEKEGWNRIDGKVIPPTKPDDLTESFDEIKPEELE